MVQGETKEVLGPVSQADGAEWQREGTPGWAAGARVWAGQEAAHEQVVSRSGPGGLAQSTAVQGP